MDGDRVAAAIAAYRPARATNQTALAAASELVTAAAPRSPREASWAMSHTYRFLLWASSTTGQPPAAAMLRDSTLIDEFVTATRNRSTRSYLSRVAAGSMTPAERQVVSRPAPPAPTTVAHAELTRETQDLVTATIDRFEPSRIDAGRWQRVRPVVADVVGRVGVARPQRALDLCRSAAYLACWVDAQHLPLEADVVFDGERIEAFLDVLVRSGAPTRSVATHASNLHALRDVLGLPAGRRRRPFARNDTGGPYTSAEIDRFFVQADHLVTPHRRRYVNSALLLLFGAGATPADVVWAEPADVEHDSAGAVTVRLRHPERVVRVLAGYGEALVAAAASAHSAGERFLIGATTLVHRDNRLHQILAGRWESTAAVDVSSARARTTWLVEAAAEPGRYPTIVEMLAEAGYQTLQRYTELIDDIRARRGVHDVGGGL